MLVQLLTVAAVVALTYLFLQLLGPRPANIFIPLSERQKWTKLLSSSLGGWLYVSNLAATLTSLATVFIFFIGSSPIFGSYIYVSVATIIVGSVITTRLTERLANSEQFKRHLDRSEVSTVAIAALFWRETEAGKQASWIARIITLVSISCILWLEFATFSTLAGSIFGFDSTLNKSFVMFFAVLFIFDFTLRNGLRGFIFTDLLHAPMILLGTLAVLIGALFLIKVDSSGALNLLTAPPKLPLPETITFVVATIFLNSFILLTGESHWIRVWAMRSQVAKSTVRAGIVMAVTWLLLIAIGLLIATTYTGGGALSVIQLVNALANLSLIYVIGFWMAGTAALFSTADAQVYSFLLVAAFNPEKGEIETKSAIIKFPLFAALSIALAFSGLYFLVTEWKLPFEQIVFFVFPLFLCLVPGLIQILKGHQVSAGPMSVALCLYLVCGIGMIVSSKFEFFFSLGAPLMPAIVAAAVAMLPAKEGEK